MMTADRDAKLDRIEQVINTWPDRCFAFDEFGPLTIRPVGGRSWYVILDNLSAHKGTKTRCWAASHQVELCFTPTCSSWANPIELHFGPLREFVLNNSNHPNHAVLTRQLQAHLRWRNANARHPDLLAAQRRERARVRSEQHRRWGRPRAA